MKKTKAKKKTSKKVTKVKKPSKSSESWDLVLYVAGNTPKSMAAIKNLKAICSNHLDPNYNIVIVDLMKTPQLAKGDQIFAVPTLVRKLPVPVRKIIGDLSDTDKVLVGLSLRSASE